MWFKLRKSIYLDTTPRKVQCTTDTYTPSVVERCWETFCKLAVSQYTHTGKTSITGSWKSTLFYSFMLLDTHTVLWRSKYQSWSGVWTTVEVAHCRAALCEQVLLGSGRGQRGLPTSLEQQTYIHILTKRSTCKWFYVCPCGTSNQRKYRDTTFCYVVGSWALSEDTEDINLLLLAEREFWFLFFCRWTHT